MGEQLAIAANQLQDFVGHDATDNGGRHANHALVGGSLRRDGIKVAIVQLGFSDTKHGDLSFITADGAIDIGLA